MRIHLHFDDDRDLSPMVVIDGEILTASEIQFSRASGLTVVDSDGNVLVGKKLEPVPPEADRAAATQRDIERFFAADESCCDD